MASAVKTKTLHGHENEDRREEEDPPTQCHRLRATVAIDEEYRERADCGGPDASSGARPPGEGDRKGNLDRMRGRHRPPVSCRLRT